jgi:multimeric flavodoxin WrbA
LRIFVGDVIVAGWSRRIQPRYHDAMDVLAVNGSPHLEGNTSFALRYALEELERYGVSTRYVALGEREIRPCRGCFACRDGECVHDDDAATILELMRESRCLLLGSPVYMGLVTAQMKALMDRSVALRVRSFQLGGRFGAGIACGGFRNGGQELTLQCMHTFFLQQDMHAIADGPGFSHSGAAIVGKAETDEIGLATVRNLAAKIAKVLEVTKPTG